MHPESGGREASGAGTPAGPPSAKPFALRAVHRAARVLAGLLGLVAVLIAGAFAVLQTEWFRERVRLFALERLRSAVNGRVEVARLRGDFLRGIALEDVSITGPAGEPFMSVNRLQVDYNVGGFLQQKILLGEVVLVKPRIALVQDAQGEWNYLRILPFLRGSEKPEPPGGWGSVVRVEQLRIVDGTVGVATRREARVFGPLGAAPEVRRLNGRVELEISALADDDRKRVAAEDLSFVLHSGLEVRELDARAAFTPEGLELDRFLLRTTGSRLSGEGKVRDLSAPILDVRLQADPLSLTELRGFTDAVPFSGSIRGTVGLAGPAEDLELTLTDFVLQTPRSRVTGKGTVTTREGPVVAVDLAFAPLDSTDARLLWGGYPLGRPLHGHLALRGSSKRLGIEGELAFGSARSEVAGTLSLSGRSPAYDVRARVTALDLQDFLRARAWASVVNGDFRLAGSGLGTAAVADFSGSLRDSRLLFYQIVQGSFAGRFSPGSFEVARFQLALPRSEIRGSGLMPYDYTLDLDVSAVSRNLQDFYPGLGPMPAARFAGTGTLTGPYSGLDLAIAGTARSLAWKGLVADSLHATGQFTDLGRPGFRMAVDGVGTRVDYLGPLAFESAEFHLGFEDDTMGVTLAAQMDSLRAAEGHLDVDFSGTTPRIVLDRGALSMATGVWRVEEPSGFAYRSGVFRFDDFAIARDAQRVVLDGTLSIDGPQDFTFALTDVSLEDLQAVAGIEPRTRGVLDASGKVGGTDRAPLIESELSLDEGRVGRLSVHRLEGRIGYAERDLRLDLVLAPETLMADSLEDPGSIAVRGTIPLDLAFGSVERRIPDRPLDLRLESRGLSLAVLQSISPRPVRASGPLQFNVHLAGRPSAPRMEGQFTLQEGRVGRIAIHSLEGRLDYAERELRMELTLAPETSLVERHEEPGSVSLRGVFPVDLAWGPVERWVPERPIDLRLEGRDLDLALLQSLFPGVTEASGPIQVDVHLAGTPSAPLFEGEVMVRDAALRAGARGVRYTGIGGTVRFDNDRILITDVKVSSPTGDARLEGEITLRELSLGDLRADLQARRFTLIDQDGKQLVVDADIDLAGTTRQPSITGAINVEQMEWPLPERSEKDVIDLDEAIIYVRAASDTVPSEPPPNVWREALLDIDVTVEDDAFLKSDRALIVLEGDLSIEKPRGRDIPLMAGSLNVVRGLYSDFGRQFEVTEGELFFYGTPDLNPGLHIIATTEVRNSDTGQDVEVTLTLGGTLQNLTLEVASNPAYEKSEIFSLLLFGTPSPGAGQEGRFQSTVTRVASTQAALPLQRALAAELNLDVLEVQPGVGAEGTSFRVGKYIANNVFVTYLQATGPRQESSFGLQYRLSRKWTIETQAGTRQFGADIFYEFQY